MRLLTCLFLLVPIFGISQNYCGFDEFRKMKHSENIAERALEQEFNDRVANAIIARRNGGNEAAAYTIPVVFHIVHSAGSTPVSEAQVEQTMDWLNASFSNTGEREFVDGIDTDIQFCLAKRDPEGNFTSGINYIESDLASVLVPSQELAFKDLSRWDPTQYCNIWVAEEITREPNSPGVLGFAVFPTDHGSEFDGIVIEDQTVGTNLNQNSVISHEMGHYLGLYHTFQDGCPNDDCLASGDRVCDTPPETSTFTNFCFDVQSTCDTDDDDLSENNPLRPVSLGGLGDQIDLATNFMDYSNLVCMHTFTSGQKERMFAAIQEYRNSLLEGDQCVPPCDDPIVVDIPFLGNSIVAGGSFSIINNSSNYETVNWTINGEYLNSATNFDEQFNTQGTYSIVAELLNGSPGCTIAYETIIEVNCPIISNFTSNAAQAQAGEALFFENAALGATSYTWLVDGIPVSAEEDLTYTFEEPGGFAVQLEAYNGICTVVSPTAFVLIGTCDTGNEANFWPTGTTGGQFNRVNFNDSPPSTDFESPIPEYNESCSAMCNGNGNLLFTVSPTQVYRADGSLMPNGSLGGSFSSRQGALPIKKPNSESEYFIFANGSEPGNTGIKYSLLDMSANSGMGSVISGQSNIDLATANSEAMTAVKHCNGDDFWIITFDRDSNEMWAFHFDETGYTGTQVSSPLAQPEEEIDFYRELKVSPKGDKLLLNRTLYNFDNNTGVCEHFMDLLYEGELLTAAFASFSPNSRFIYIQFEILSPFSLVLAQYDLDLENPIDINDEHRSMSIGVGVLDALLLGLDVAPNGEIWMPHSTTGFVSIIRNPNNFMPDISLDFNALTHNGSPFWSGNSAYYHAYISGKQIWIEGQDQICAGETQHYNVFGGSCLDQTPVWGASPGLQMATENGEIDISFSTPGEYYVTATIETDCGTLTDSLFIAVADIPELDLGLDGNLCEGTTRVLDATDAFDEYEWNDGSTATTLEATEPGTYWVEVEYSFNCVRRDSVIIEEFMPATIDLGEDFELCEGDIAILTADFGFTDYVWQDGTTGPNYTVFEGGTYTVSTTVPCDATDTIVVDDCGIQIDDPIDSVLEIDAVSVQLLPNPSQGEIQISGLPQTKILAEIYNAEGKIVFSETLNVQQNTAQIEFQEISTGIYTLQLSGSFGTIAKQLIKQ